MDINVTESLCRQMVLFYELEDFRVFRLGYQGKNLYERKDFGSVPNIAAGKLANNEWVVHPFSISQ
jgi:hypothetical protein